VNLAVTAVQSLSEPGSHSCTVHHRSWQSQLYSASVNLAVIAVQCISEPGSHSCTEHQ